MSSVRTQRGSDLQNGTGAVQLTAPNENEDAHMGGGEYCPTPEQIEAECRRIRDGWTDRERRRRAGMPSGRAARWMPPQVRVSISDLQTDFSWAG